jgi:hypothetical protein
MNNIQNNLGLLNTLGWVRSRDHENSWQLVRDALPWIIVDDFTIVTLDNYPTALVAVEGEVKILNI